MATDVELKCIHGAIPVLGFLRVDVCLGKPTSQQTLLVVGCKSPILCGQDWLSTFNLLPGQVNTTQLVENATELMMQNMQREFEHVLKPGCGELKGPPLHVDLRLDAQPRYYRTRSVPYALREKVDDEEIITSVDHSVWASPKYQC